MLTGATWADAGRPEDGEADSREGRHALAGRGEDCCAGAEYAGDAAEPVAGRCLGGAAAHEGAARFTKTGCIICTISLWSDLYLTMTIIIVTSVTILVRKYIT